MRLMICSIIWKIFFLRISNGSAPMKTEDYAHIITDIYKFSKSSAVSLMYSTADKNLSQKNLIFNVQVLLMREKIMTSAINFEKVSSLTKGGFSNFDRLIINARTMSVFLLWSIENLTKMQKSLRFLRRNGDINLVFFIKTEGTPLLEFCMNPKGNPFILNEGISLLVKCYDDTLIREWNSLNKNEIRVYDRATWEPENGLIVISKKLVLNDTDILNGKVLQLAIGPVSLTGGDEYLNNVCRALESAGNFTMRRVVVAKKNNRWNENPYSLNGSYGLIARREVDILRGFFSLSSRKLSVIEFSEILSDSFFGLIIRRPEAKIIDSGLSLLKPFTIELWIALIFSLIIIQAIRVFMKKTLKSDLHENYIVDDFLYVWAIYCQQSLPVFPKVSSLKMFYCTSYFFTFCVFSIYSARFISKLTITDPNLPFKTMEEFSKVKSHKLIIPNESFRYKFKNAKISPWKDIGDLLIESVRNEKDFANMICRNNVAIMTHVQHMRNIKNKTTCPMVFIRTKYRAIYAMALRKNSPYNRAINHLLKRLRSHGILNRFKSKIFYKRRIYEMKEKQTAVTFLDIVILLIIFLGSIVLSVIILLFEIFTIGSEGKKL